MLNLSIAGNVGADPELKNTSGGHTVLNFSVAVSGYDPAKREKTTQWVRCAVWGKRGESLAKLLKKGDKVACGGPMKLREYEGRNGPGVSLELETSDVTLQGGNASGGGGVGVGGGGGSGGNASRFPASGGTGGAASMGDDDIPF